MPEAQLDRFLFKVMVEFPTREELRGIVNLTENTEKPQIEKPQVEKPQNNKVHIEDVRPIQKDRADYITDEAPQE